MMNQDIILICKNKVIRITSHSYFGLSNAGVRQISLFVVLALNMFIGVILTLIRFAKQKLRVSYARKEQVYFFACPPLHFGRWANLFRIGISGMYK